MTECFSSTQSGVHDQINEKCYTVRMKEVQMIPGSHEVREQNGLIEAVRFTNDCVCDVKNIFAVARDRGYRAVNSVMIQANWLVGMRIVKEEQQGRTRAKYGARVIEKLAKALCEERGSGVSEANLANCRQFYLTFPSPEILYTVCRKLSWSHLRAIMRLDTQTERDYYMAESERGAWSVRELERNIKTDMFHRVLQNQVSDVVVEPKRRKILSQVKDPYVLEFLNVKPDVKTTEKGLENAIISNIEKFLLEMGKGFSFVERQMHVKTETQDFYIDLVFYNYILKCFVLIDLKRGALRHQDIGQMDMYVRMFDAIKRSSDDNPTIGIIFCTKKDESIVRYSVLHESEQIFASKYRTVLPTEEELSIELDRNRRYLEEK